MGRQEWRTGASESAADFTFEALADVIGGSTIFVGQSGFGAPGKTMECVRRSISVSAIARGVFRVVLCTNVTGGVRVRKTEGIEKETIQETIRRGGVDRG